MRGGCILQDTSLLYSSYLPNYYSFSPDNKEIMNSNVLGIPKQSEDLLYFEQHCHSVQDNFV